ncbi:PREDICTED: dynein assembly factor 1, axonemal homolog [Trachymyrmex septentrionalis]|uniref:dynein assembly factor 1, axonemal homolog n=1 Tax=Trachymyrmex septentrionalis TaxID=34720 RepID=UPI00084F4FEA|nr:PREDICTED: dynein assembly factor 1, axonemal homolog [Trachymyrmex septentrionalis]
MNAFKLGDKALDNTHELSFNFPTEDNNSQTSVSYVINTNVSPVPEHKIVMDCPTECKVLNNTVKTQFEVKKCENLCESEKTEATNNVDEYDIPTISFNCTDLNNENPSYFNSSIKDCDVSIYEYFDCNDKTIQEEDFEDSEKTIQNQFLTDDQHTNSSNNLTEFRDSLNIDSVHEKICRIRCGKEKFIDSRISTNGLIAENFINSQNIPESDDVTCKIIEEDTKNKEMNLAQNITCINIEDSFQEELDTKNLSVSAIESGNYFISNNENYFKNDIDLSKCMEENANHMLSICTEKDSIEETITEIKKMDKIIKNFLYTSDDEHYDSTEERMIEDLSAKIEDDRDDVMKKIIESCCHAVDFQQRSMICEISSADSIQSSSKYVIKEFRENEFFPCRRVVSETAIAKEDILRTIEEAEKILTDSPYWEKSEAIVNQMTENYDKNNSSEKSAEEVKDDKEHERVNETIGKKEIDFIETKDNKINSANTIEKIAVSKSDVVENNLQKLAEITCSDRPRSRIEVQETLEKIAEEKRKIENRKNESLETLSKKFEEIDKLVADHNCTFLGSDNDSYELKTPENVDIDFDSLGEFQVQIGPENFEIPLTKSEITEKLKIEELEKELEDEIKEHKKLMDEYQKIIATDLEKIQLTLESESMQTYNGADINKEIENKSKDDEKISEEFSNEILEMTDDTTVAKIDSESDDFFMEEWKEPERTYIKGKVYDFDEKKHGVRMTEELIRKHCKEHKLYQTPYLNDVLYLHYKGFSFIENLEKYTGLKCLWLESNGIYEIANLENQSELKSLYLHHNLISKIENLDCLPKLDTLNLSHNTIRRIENLDGLKFLNNLNLSHNYLRETADIEHLRLLHTLSILDISHNRIDTCDIVDILGDMKSLRVVTLSGNPVLKQIKMYRKTMILKCKNLQYLDDRPVFPRDRACAEAWMRGGVDEEVAERNRWFQAEQKKINDSVMALINKRKLCKPVGTSEKEATDKKKKEKKEEEEDEEEEEEEDEEVTTKSSARTATRSSGLLDLEKKKKSEDRSFLGSYDSPLSSSSSEDEQLANDEENERSRQKGGKESDGRRPMAEQEKKVPDENNGELLLPWKAKVQEEIQPRTLIEEISESKHDIAGDAERKWHRDQILNNYESMYDSLDDGTVNKKTVSPKKEVLELQLEKEMTADLQESISNNNKANDRKSERTFTCSVSCDTSDLKQMLEEYHKPTNEVTNEKDDISNKNIKSYQRKSRFYPFGSKLSSIREEMREFCDSMDRFVDENKIVFKNGEVEGFWGERKMVDQNLQTDFVDDSKIQETGTKVSVSEEDKLRWWSTKERKLKVKEILNKREDEVKENKVEAEDTKRVEKSDRCSSEDKKQLTDATSYFQDVHDLTALKASPSSVLPDSMKTYSVKNAANYESEQSLSIQQEESHGVFHSLFTELRNRDIRECIHKPKISTELMALEEKLDNEKLAFDPEKKNICTLINTKDLVNSNEQYSECENSAEKNNSVKIEIFEDKVNDLSFESPERKKNIDESDDDSFKTALSVQEDSQILESSYELPKVLKLANKENNFDKIIDSIQNENIDHSMDNNWKEVISNQNHNDAIYENEKIYDGLEKSSDKTEISKSEREFSTETEQCNSQMESLVRTIDHLSLERASHSSRLTGKRTREAEDVEVSNKKSFLIKEMNLGKKLEERKSRSQISERCRQHLIQETKKFAKKVSPLIDKCITHLIKDAENANGKSQSYKYNQRNPREYLPSGYTSKMNLSKSAGDFGERNNYHDKCDNKSNDVTNTSTYSERQELMTEQTINSQFAASAHCSDIQSLANLFRQSQNSESQSPAVNANVSLYEEFCDHLQKLENSKKLLIKPDFTMDNKQSEEILSHNKLQKTECSVKKSIKPLIQIISEHPTTYKNSEQTSSEQTEIKQSHGSQTTSYCKQKDAVLRKSEEETKTSDDFENHINLESGVNLKEGIKIEMFTTSYTIENAEYKEECVLPNEERKTVTTNMKKSIEMQVAQEN